MIPANLTTNLIQTFGSRWLNSLFPQGDKFLTKPHSETNFSYFLIDLLKLLI